MQQSEITHPNFFLVGASRSGTTSLWHYLNQHPDVFMPSHGLSAKEPSFFCDIKPCWAEPYRDPERYLALFAGANGQRAIGEASTPYLVAPESPRRLRDAYPNARIVVVLRNPADRAYSLYQYLCALGVEWVPTFERALAEEERRLRSESFRLHNTFWYYAYLYFTTGLYAAQIQRYLATFPREQVHILLADDLERDPIRTTRRVYRFLGVHDGFEPRTQRYNASGRPLFLRLHYGLGRKWQSHPLREATAPRLRDRLRRTIFRANLKLGRVRRASFARDTRQALLSRYRDDILATAALIERNLTPWLRGEPVPQVN